MTPHQLAKACAISAITWGLLIWLVMGCAISGATVCDGTKTKDGEVSRVSIGDGISVEARGGSCR